MRISVLYFAVFRERIGRDEEALELAAGATVADALAALAGRHTAIAQLRGRFRVAVNQDFVDEGFALADRDELALIPPVAGGQGHHVVLTDEPLSLDRCLAAVRGPGMGGIVTFTGMVRRYSPRRDPSPRDATRGGVNPAAQPPERGREGPLEIDHLEYEAYGPMAVKVMAELCAEIEGEVAGARLAVEHRVGHLAIGDIAVVIAAAAPHRAEAFTACRALIDRLKDRVPIWKKEVGTDGAEWVGLGP